MSGCPRYSPTAVRSLKGLAYELGLGELLLKDETARFGLQSFKALGGAYAVGRLLQRLLAEPLGFAPELASLAAGAHRELTTQLVVVCATDGNHGRSVAAGARLFGCRSRIFLHGGVSSARAAAISSFGAELVRVAGDYDDSVRAAAEAARAYGAHLVADTSSEGDEQVPNEVMQGYGVLFDEAVETCGRPTHVFLQAGVGGLAAAGAAYLADRFGPERPRLVVVEPERADCLQASVREGRLTTSGDLETVMAMLACGEPSPVAWRVLDQAADAFLTIPDQLAVEALSRLAAAPEVVSKAGESGVAGLAGVLACARDKEWRNALGLDAEARVLLVATEAPTDPQLYSDLLAMGEAGRDEWTLGAPRRGGPPRRSRRSVRRPRRPATMRGNAQRRSMRRWTRCDCCR
jgi:diaminopropionate ammonia-lyase